MIAIDPGCEQSAFVVWYGAIQSFGKCPNQELLDRLRRGFDQEHPACPIIVEMVACYGMAVGKEVFETCVWIGRFAEAYERSTGVKPCYVYRREVKMHLCGNMRAKDANIRQALIDKIGQPGTKKSPGPTYGISGDVWSALAVAVTWEETQS